MLKHLGCPLSALQVFLDEADKYGKEISTSFGDAKSDAQTVSSEARMLKRMFLKLRD